MKKIISIILTFSMLAVMASISFATIDGVPGLSVTPTMEVSDAKQPIQDILGAIQWIGYAFAIGMLVYVGIKYTMSAANEKANLKGGLINWIIGAILVAGVSTICGWVVSFGESLGGS